MYEQTSTFASNTFHTFKIDNEIWPGCNAAGIEGDKEMVGIPGRMINVRAVALSVLKVHFTGTHVENTCCVGKAF